MNNKKSYPAYLRHNTLSGRVQKFSEQLEGKQYEILGTNDQWFLYKKYFMYFPFHVLYIL